MRTTFLIIIFMLTARILCAQVFEPKFTADIYGGWGRRTIHNTDLENPTGQPSLLASLRVGYRPFKFMQLETGHTFTRYVAADNWWVDKDRYFGASYRTSYHNFPLILRIRPYKGWWIGGGAQYSLLHWGRYYPEFYEKEYENIRSQFNSGVWNMYADIKWMPENFGFGINYSRSITPVHKINNSWEMSYFNIYMVVDISLFIKRYYYRNF